LLPPPVGHQEHERWVEFDDLVVQDGHAVTGFITHRQRPRTALAFAFVRRHLGSL
jgi:hypothetical protein